MWGSMICLCVQQLANAIYMLDDVDLGVAGHSIQGNVRVLLLTVCPGGLVGPVGILPSWTSYIWARFHTLLKHSSNSHQKPYEHW